MRAAFSFTLLISTSFGVVAQPQPDDKRRISPHPQVERVGLHEFQGRLVGLGDGFRAEFDADGVTFTPSLGAGAPAAMPLRMALRSIGRACGAVDPAIAVEPRHADRTVTYARSSCTEQWQVRPDGIAQSFRFDALPAGRGDLVVRSALDTDLPLVRSDGGELVFALDKLGGVRIREVRGIDADGRVAAGSMGLRGGELVLSLPEAFVDSAALPLVLDPIVETWHWTTGSTTLTQDNPVTAMTHADLGIIAYEEIVSAADREVRVVVVPTGELALITAPRPFARIPAAAAQTGGRYCVATRMGSLTSPDVGVWLLELDHEDDFELQTLGLYTLRSGGHSMGGDLPAVGPGVLAYRRGPNEIAAVPLHALDPSGGLIGPETVFRTFRPVRHVSITRSATESWAPWYGTRRHVVAYETGPTPSGGAIDALVLTGGGLARRPLTAEQVLDVSSSTGNHERPAVAIDHLQRTVVFAWERELQPGSGDKDIACRTMVWRADASQPSLVALNAETIVEGDLGENERRPSVTMLDGTTILTYEEEDPTASTPGSFRGMIRWLDAYSLVDCAPKSPVPFYGDVRDISVDGGIPLPSLKQVRNAFLVGTVDHPGPFPISNTRSATLTETPRYDLIGPWCSAGGRADAPGATITNPAFAFRLVGSRANVPAMLLYSAVPGMKPLACCGSLYVDSSSAVAIIVTTDWRGTAVVPATLPPSLIHSFLHYQWWVSPSGSCSVQAVSTAHRVRIGS